jgi:predicted ester cyclase
MTSLEETRQVIDKYLHGHDTSVFAENSVFEVMASGQKANGRAGIEQLLEYFYTKAFTAEFAPISVTVGEGKAVLEADFHGKQNLEFAGIQPSGKEVHVPLCVCYDVSDGKITYARIYFETDAIRMQK